MGKKKSVRWEKASDAATAEDFRQQIEPIMTILDEKATTDKEKAKHLRAYYRLGALSLKLAPDHKGYGTGLLKRHAEAVGRPYGFLSVARRFAFNYEREDLDQLCENPVGVSHLRALVDIKNKGQRARLQKQAHDQKLSVAGLFELKKQKIDPKRAGGAPVKVADNPKIAVMELLGDGEAWVRRCDATRSKLNEISGKRVPADLQDVAEEGIERLRAVSNAVRRVEKELKRLVGDA